MTDRELVGVFSAICAAIPLMLIMICSYRCRFFIGRHR